jgi:hypothetical protein
MKPAEPRPGWHPGLACAIPLALLLWIVIAALIAHSFELASWQFVVATVVLGILVGVFAFLLAVRR